MSQQGKLSCPSCESSFEPTPNGGFCPDCDTPHPDYDHGDQTDTEDSLAAPVEGAKEQIEEPDDADEESVESVTLVLNEETYTFEDGETFGRRSDGWLDDLIEAAGGKDEVVYISGEHLEFSFEDDGVYVEDVSRNGTALNGTALDGDRAKLEDGDSLTLAKRAEIEVAL